MFTDDDRRVLYESLEARIGVREAAILMAHLPPAGWAELATRQDLHALDVKLTGEMKALVHRVWAANVATMIGLTGMVFAVASFAR